MRSRKKKAGQQALCSSLKESACRYPKGQDGKEGGIREKIFTMQPEVVDILWIAHIQRLHVKDVWRDACVWLRSQETVTSLLTILNLR